MASEKVHTFTDDNFEKDVLQSEIPVLVDFWATWCAPCKAIAPLLDAVADEYDGKIKVGKVNVDDNPATPGKYGVRGIPTVILIKGGKVVDQVVGAVPKAQLEALIKKATQILVDKKGMPALQASMITKMFIPRLKRWKK